MPEKTDIQFIALISENLKILRPVKIISLQLQEKLLTLGWTSLDLEEFKRPYKVAEFCYQDLKGLNEFIKKTAPLVIKIEITGIVTNEIEKNIFKELDLKETDWLLSLVDSPDNQIVYLNHIKTLGLSTIAQLFSVANGLPEDEVNRVQEKASIGVIMPEQVYKQLISTKPIMTEACKWVVEQNGTQPTYFISADYKDASQLEQAVNSARLSAAALSGIKHYLKPGILGCRLSWNSMFFDSTRGFNRAKVYKKALESNEYTMRQKCLIMYALLASHDGKTLQGDMAEAILGVRDINQARVLMGKMLNNYYIPNDRAEKETRNKFDKIAKDIVIFANNRTNWSCFSMPELSIPASIWQGLDQDSVADHEAQFSPLVKAH